MKSLLVVIGVVVVLVLLVSSGVFGGGACLRGVGCIYSTGDGIRMDNSQQATISVE